MSLQLKTKKRIIRDFLNKRYLFTPDTVIDIDLTGEGLISRIFVQLKHINIDLSFYSFSKVLSIDVFGGGIKHERRTFEEWTQFIEAFGTGSDDVEETLRRLTIARFVFACAFRPFIQDVFKLIQETNGANDHVDESIINLVPINKNLRLESPEEYTLFLDSKSKKWYKNLLSAYEQNINNKIAKRYYQDQARLHGLQFVGKVEK